MSVLVGAIRVMIGRDNMKTALILAGALVASTSLHGAVRYVNVNNPNPMPPYLDWAGSASNIQDAVDEASTGDEIVVTNGVYQTGSRQFPASAGTNRVLASKTVTVRSVNGSWVTVIRGEPGVRCAYLAEGAVLVGFTLTQGDSREGGGVYGGTLSNCVLRANTAVNGGGAASSRLMDCLMISNTATDGGGAWNCELVRCELIENQASEGGGFWGPPCAGNDGRGPSGCPPPTTCDSGGCGLQPGVARECTFVGNVALEGGGAYGGWLRDCTLMRNLAQPDGTSAMGGRGGGVTSSHLSGCILRNNRADSGGGAFGAILLSCGLTGNSAFGSFGGGASMAWLSGCTLTGNSAAIGGGGVYSSTLENCVLMANEAFQGGGAWGGSLSQCTVVANVASSEGGGVWSECRWGPSGPLGSHVAVVRNSIVFDNAAPSHPNHAGFPGSGSLGGVLNYSCTTPLPSHAVGNITNAPLFMHARDADFRLLPHSPCINAGHNAYAAGAQDRDLNPRSVGGTVDMGAYEFQMPLSRISYAWLQQYGLPTDGSADFGDPDADGHNNLQEWRAWTDPTEAVSALRLLTPLLSSNGLLIRWRSIAGNSYALERGTDLGGHLTFAPLASNIVGQAETTAFSDSNAVGATPLFYRVVKPE